MEGGIILEENDIRTLRNHPLPSMSLSLSLSLSLFLSLSLSLSFSSVSLSLSLSHPISCSRACSFALPLSISSSLLISLPPPLSGLFCPHHQLLCQIINLPHLRLLPSAQSAHSALGSIMSLAVPSFCTLTLFRTVISCLTLWISLHRQHSTSSHFPFVLLLIIRSPVRE